MEGWIWILAGHNGAGKTTLARTVLASIFEDAEHINADDITSEIAGKFGASMGSEANLKAAQIADALFDDCIADRQPCVVETVLSSEKYKDRVLRAKAQGMSVGLVYVVLSSADLAVERVALRVAAGGHDVPEEKIRARRERSIENLAWFAQQADAVFVFCNDDPNGSPVLLASTQSGRLELHKTGVVPEIDHALAPILPA